jgi:signal transduction histidine kinase
LLCVQLAAVVAMAIIVPWAGMSQFLVIIAWQVAMATTPAQSAELGRLSDAGDYRRACAGSEPRFVLGHRQVFRAAAAARLHGAGAAKGGGNGAGLGQTNRELRSAQAIIANNVRDAERLRISRELHDAWGHELTALGLQLEIASHVTEPGRANDHVMQAKGLAAPCSPRCATSSAPCARPNAAT